MAVQPNPEALPEGIFSFLDTDLYKLTMQCAILKYLPDISKRRILSYVWAIVDHAKEVTYAFTNRTPNMRLNRAAYHWLLQQVFKLGNISLSLEELNYLKTTCTYFNDSYLRFLSSFHFDPSRQVKVSFIPLKDTGSLADVGDLHLDVGGLWVDTILYEVPLLALTSEAYFRFCDQDWTHEGQEEQAYTKAQRLIERGCSFSEFGTRRRRDYHTHDLVMKGLIRAATDTEDKGSKGVLTGTSNVHFAKKYGIPPVGTVAHEWFMGIASITNDYEHANETALRYWVGCFGEGVLGIALTDTFGTPTFLKAFKKSMPTAAEAQRNCAMTQLPETLRPAISDTNGVVNLDSAQPSSGALSTESVRPKTYAQTFTGVRQDSGDPLQFVKLMRDFYDSEGIQEKKKIVFSDSLNIELCLEYKEVAEKAGFVPTFGIGTFFTNDFTHASNGKKSTPLNIVIKLSSASGRPAIKISDNIGKNTGDSETVHKVKETLGYIEKQWSMGDERTRWGSGREEATTAELERKIECLEAQIEHLTTQCRQLKTENDWERHHASQSHQRYIDALKRVYSVNNSVSPDQQCQELKTLWEEEKSMSRVFVGALHDANEANQLRSPRPSSADAHSKVQKTVGKGSVSKPKYGLVLLDGNVMQFSSEQMTRIAAGHAMAQTILKLAQESFGEDQALLARVCIYADIHRLAQSYVASGVFKFPDDFLAWIKSFNGADPWVEIYDVGWAKNASKRRVQELLEMNLRDGSCFRIIFGGELNDMHVSMLREESNTSRRLVFVAGSTAPLGRHGSIPADCFLAFDNIFRPTPVAPSANTTRLLAPVQRDEQGRRIDPRICVNQAMIPYVSRQKYCNNQYLRGKCVYKGCRQNHDAKLNQEELTTLAFLARCLQYGGYGGAGSGGYGQTNPYEGQGSRYDQGTDNPYSQQVANPYAQQHQGGGYDNRYGGQQAPNGAGGAGYGGNDMEMTPLNGQTASSGASTARDPNGILNECRNIDQGIDSIQGNLVRLRSLQQRAIDDPDASQGTQTNDALDRLSSETMTLYRNFGARIKAVKQQKESGDPRNRPQVGLVDRKLKKAINEYQQLDRDFRHKLAAQMERQYRIVRPDASDQEVREAIEDTSNNQVFSQALMTSNRRGQSQSALRAVQGRHEAIQKIERQMIELAQLFQDMEAAVVEQEPAVMDIEQKGEETVVNLGKGNEQLDSAVEKAHAARRKKWICLGIVVLILLIIVAVVVVVVVVTRK
ncbi:MAG: hypothetical protein Q9163_001496 [Psora crenata]